MSNTRKPPASPSSLCLRYCVPDWARWPDQPGSAAARGLVMRRVGRATPPRTSGGRASSGGTRSPLTRGCRPPAVGCRSHNLLTAARPWPLLRTPSRGVHCSDEVGRSPESALFRAVVTFVRVVPGARHIRYQALHPASAGNARIARCHGRSDAVAAATTHKATRPRHHGP